MTLKQCLIREFEIKKQRKLKYLFEIEVANTKLGIFRSKQKYTIACKLTKKLIDLNHKLGLPGDPDVDNEMYQRLVEKLIYLSCTKLDITYAVGEPIHAQTQRDRSTSYLSDTPLLEGYSCERNYVQEK